MKLKVSKGNSKMGNIPSISLPAGKTCRPDCECYSKCYAVKLTRFRPNVKASYEANYDLLQKDPDTYWREVEASVMMSHFFRYNVCGDIPDSDYFNHMVEIAIRHSHCHMLCFTKKYRIVNSHIRDNGPLPMNLHVLFSAWKGMRMENPYHLPEAHVLFRDGSTTARPGAIKCIGKCTECAMSNRGCWAAREGDQILLEEH